MISRVAGHSCVYCRGELTPPRCARDRIRDLEAEVERLKERYDWLAGHTKNLIRSCRELTGLGLSIKVFSETVDEIIKEGGRESGPQSAVKAESAPTGSAAANPAARKEV